MVKLMRLTIVAYLFCSSFFKALQF